MFLGNEKLQTPMFIRPPKWISWNKDGKILWGGDSYEAVNSSDPDGPAVYYARRLTDSSSHLYELITEQNA